jgi:hypothetical protein
MEIGHFPGHYSLEVKEFAETKVRVNGVGRSLRRTVLKTESRELRSLRSTIIKEA